MRWGLLGGGGVGVGARALCLGVDHAKNCDVNFKHGEVVVA